MQTDSEYFFKKIVLNNFLRYFELAKHILGRTRINKSTPVTFIYIQKYRFEKLLTGTNQQLF